MVLEIAIGLMVLLCLLSTLIVGHLAIGSLEWSYPPSVVLPTRADTIVVLAGNIDMIDQEGIKVRIGGETLFRCLHAFELYDQAGGCRIVVSGGSVDRSKPSTTAAEAMRDFLLLLGVKPADLILEKDSTTTYENVRNTCALLRQDGEQRIFLVTTAWHMRRAEGCFTRQGMKIIPAPCNHLAVQLELSPIAFVPSLNGIGGVHRAVHEWLGLVWYRLRGRI